MPLGLGNILPIPPTDPQYVENNYSLSFDGTDDYIKYTVDGSGHSVVVGRMMGQTNTHIFWVKPTDIASGERPLLNIGDEANYQYSIYIDTSGYINLNCSTGGVSCIRRSTTALVDDTWKQVAVVFDGTEGAQADRLTFYINGVDAGLTGSGGSIPATIQVSSDSDNTTANAVAYVGYRDNDGAQTKFKGLINSYAFFYTALSGTAISGLCDIPVNGYLRGYDVYDPIIDYTHANMDVTWLMMGDGTESGAGTHLYNMALLWSGTSQSDWAYGADLDGATFVDRYTSASNVPQTTDD